MKKVLLTCSPNIGMFRTCSWAQKRRRNEIVQNLSSERKSFKMISIYLWIWLHLQHKSYIYRISQNNLNISNNLILSLKSVFTLETLMFAKNWDMTKFWALKCIKQNITVKKVDILPFKNLYNEGGQDK